MSGQTKEFEHCVLVNDHIPNKKMAWNWLKDTFFLYNTILLKTSGLLMLNLLVNN